MKTIQQITDNEAFKALYFDRERLALRPNLVFVHPNGSIVFETNEIGLKGDPLDPDRKLAVVWGDSVVFSVGRGWPCLLDAHASGWQFLNGGLDGDLYTNVLERAVELNRRHAVGLNVLFPGWHPVDYRTELKRDRKFVARLRKRLSGAPDLQVGNRNLPGDLTAFLQEVPNTVVVTMPTALNPRIVNQDISAYFADGDDSVAFNFLGVLTYTVPIQRVLYDHIVERNEIVRGVAAQTGTPVVDFFRMFDTTELADFRRDFRDILHFRPTRYEYVAKLLYDEIAGLLR